MATVKGKVVDSLTSKGLKEATVSLDAEGITVQHFSAETDEEGNFLLSNIPAGLYTLHVQFSPESMHYSFGDSIENVELSEDAQKELFVPIEITGALIGRVRDATNGIPLQGVFLAVGVPASDRREWRARRTRGCHQADPRAVHRLPRPDRALARGRLGHRNRSPSRGAWPRP